MKTKIGYLVVLLCMAWALPQAVYAGDNYPSIKDEDDGIKKLNNPMSVQYLKKYLSKSQPRLVLNSKIEKQLKNKLKTDPVVKNIYEAIKLNATDIQREPFLERIQTGRRLLSISREMLYRINMLGMVYRIKKDPIILKRIDGEVKAVCNFSDWNPSHFLDVAEMSMAVAFALDWTAGALPASTIELAKNALIEKGLKPSWPESGKNPGWAYGHNNWNQVCNGGMIAASIAIAEKDPELAAKTIKRGLDGMVNALAQYSPDGVYPEGSTYWAYGTSFSVVTSAFLESAFGTDFGIADYPAFKESAKFRYLMNTPSGWYYNFADCGDKRGNNGDFTLAWFATKTGNKELFEKERFLMKPSEMGELRRLDGAALVWISQFKEGNAEAMPTAWKGDGSNPIVVFKGDNDYYFGGKGGRATTSHGNMDAGSFIFELNGVRWAIDAGNQKYHDLEKTGFDLWASCQDCQRWTLLTKNNFGHSTITVNNSLLINDATASLLEFKGGTNPEATFDLAPIYGENIKSAKRRFVKDGAQSVVIEDAMEISEKTEMITWQLMTQADVKITKGGAILTQDGKSLKLENLSHPDLELSIVSLYPAPMKLDRQIEGLKRLELRIPAWTLKDGKCNLKIRLSGN